MERRVLHGKRAVRNKADGRPTNTRRTLQVGFEMSEATGKIGVGVVTPTPIFPTVPVCCDAAGRTFLLLDNVSGPTDVLAVA